MGTAWPDAPRPSWAASGMAEELDVSGGILVVTWRLGLEPQFSLYPGQKGRVSLGHSGRVSDIRTPKYLTGQGKCLSIQASKGGMAYMYPAQEKRSRNHSCVGLTFKEHVMKMSPTSSSELGCVPSAVFLDTWKCL